MTRCEAVACARPPRPLGCPFCGEHWWQLPEAIRVTLEGRSSPRRWAIAMGIAVQLLAQREGHPTGRNGFVQLAQALVREAA